METLSPNDVISCLWNKDSAEKCRIGLADVVLYENGIPAKWMVTGKTGEITKKRTVDFPTINKRWSRIAEQTDSPIIAIIRQHGGILKYLNAAAWFAFNETIVPDSSCQSLHCFVKGNNKFVYRNKYELKDKMGRYISSTHVYSLEFDHTVEAVSIQYTDKAPQSESKAVALKSVIDLATNTVVRYLELMLGIRIVKISIDYVIDAQSQLWMMWTSEALFVRGKNLNELSIPGVEAPKSADRMTWAGPKLREGIRDMEFEGRTVAAYSPGSTSRMTCRRDSDVTVESDSGGINDEISLSTKKANKTGDLTIASVHAQVGTAEDTLVKKTQIDARRRGEASGHSKSEKTFDVHHSIPAVNESSFPDPFKCKGDYCRVRVHSTGPLSLSSRAAPHTMEKFFSDSEITTLRKDRRFAQMMEFGADGPALASISMKSILKARAERRGVTAVAALPWAEYPKSPRHQTTHDDAITEEQTHEDMLASDKLHREKFTKSMITYYEKVRVCGVCYNVYSILDWARNVLGDTGAHGPLEKSPSRKSVSAKFSGSIGTASRDPGADSFVDTARSSFSRESGSRRSIGSSSVLSKSRESSAERISPNSRELRSKRNQDRSGSKSPGKPPGKTHSTAPKTGTWKDFVDKESAAKLDITAKSSTVTGAAGSKAERQKLKDLDDYLRKGAEALAKRKADDKAEFMSKRVTQLLQENSPSKASNSFSNNSLASGGSLMTGSNAYRGKILLVCEDNIHGADAVALLESSLFDVYWCKDGRSAINMFLNKTEEEQYDCVIAARDAPLADAFAIVAAVREGERKVRKRAAAVLAAQGSGAPPVQKRHPVICFTDCTAAQDIKRYMEADMDGCVSYPVNAASMLNTVRAAIPHHLAIVEPKVASRPASQESQSKVFKIGALGVLEGSADSATMAVKTLPLASGGSNEDCSVNGVIQIDADTRIPYTVLDASKTAKVRFNRRPFFNLVVCHDLFDTSERMKIVLRPLVEQYVGLQVLVWNYPGQAFTEWRAEQLLNNEYMATCLNELLGQVGDKGTNDFDTTKPFYLLGFGYGANIGAYYAAHYRVSNLRGLLQVNGWTYLDSYMAGLLHDCVNVFECSPPSRPDLPVYFFSRFLFSKDYLAKVSVPLALNIYTAVHNPISITGRIGICKGVLRSVDLRPTLKEIDCPIICIHSTQDAFARPLQTDSYIQHRGGEVRSIFKALKNPSKTCIVWVKSGHEIFQENKKHAVTVIEQIVTGFHETHDISFSAAGTVDNVAAERGSVPNTVGATVEDRFIDNILTKMSKVSDGSLSRQSSPNRQSTAPMNRPDSSLNQGSQASLASTLPNISNVSNGKQNASLFSATDPNAWQSYAAEIHQSLDARAVTKKQEKAKETAAFKPNLVLDPNSISFAKQDSIYKRVQGDNNLQEYPEVKEYMSWRLKRNKKRLQRLQQAARTIQGGFRAHIARQFVKRVRRQTAATTIQRYVRGWLGRCKFLEEVRRMWGALTIQRVYRGFLARQLYFVMKTRNAAAGNIQRVVRGYQARLYINKVRLIRNHAATIIQAMFRRRKARRVVWRMRVERNASMLIQRIFRGHLGRRRAIAERDKYIFSRSQSQGIEFGRQMLLEHKLHATRLQSDVTLLTQEKVSAEEQVEALLEEISGFEEGVRTLEKEMHQLAKVEAEAAAFMDADSKYELREQKIRLDKEFGEMLAKIGGRKEMLTSLEKKLSAIDKTRQGKEEELRTLERKLVVLLEEQQNELNAIRRKQDVRGQLLAASHDEIMKASSAGGPGGQSQALVVAGGSGGGGGGGGGGPSMQEKRQAAQLMQSTETLMKFGFMSMSMTYFSSLNMIKALRTVSAQDTVMAALADVHAQRAVNFGMPGNEGPQSKGNFVPDLKGGQLPGQEALRVSAWSVDDVSKWLQTISLGQYSEAFIDAAIDGEFLYDLNDDDLKNTLGIEHRLHRKKILNCVHRLKLAEAQADSRLNAILQEGGGLNPPMLNPDQDPNAGFATNPFENGDPRGDSGDRRFVDGPKVPLQELFSYVRHAKLNLLKEALDYLPNKPFDPSLVQSKYVMDHGTVYLDGYDRLPFHLNKIDEFGNNMLGMACQNGNSKVVKYLIAKGANMNHQNKAGQTPAHFAVAYKFFDLSHWLFENGADDRIENKFGLSPYDGLMPEGYVEEEG